MRDKSEKAGSIPSLLSEIHKTYDLVRISELENQMACMLASPIMFLGALVSIAAYYFFLSPQGDTILNSIIFLVLGISFELLRKSKLDYRRVSILITLLYIVWLLFFIFRMYYILGPAVWVVACIQMVFSLSRIKKDMAVFLGLTAFLSSIFILLDPADFVLTLSFHTFVPQTVTLLILILVLSIAHRINTNRFYNLLHQYETILEQKNDITSLYEEISASEEELRSQNDLLTEYAEDIRKGEEALHHLAYYDVLTGLPNRTLFLQKVTSRIENPSYHQSPFYLIFIDIDSFKKINDTMGHNVGDEFILHAANHLKNAITEADFLGRIGGDEFVLMIDQKISKTMVLTEIENVRKKFCVPYNINNVEIRLTASFGIAVYPTDGSSTLELLQSADMAMYEAKSLGKNTVRFYSPYMRAELINKTRMESLMFTALENDEFYLVFQPQYYADTSKIRGFEVLLRWTSAELGIIPPSTFIPVAEETGFIRHLGEWILISAFRKYVELQRLYSTDAVLCINISAVQLNDINFINIVNNALASTGMETKNLEFEITETVFIDSFKNAIIIMGLLKNMGIRIALDDFGVGYSSLNYLKNLPIDTLKIDKVFIDDLSDSQEKQPIVGDIISLGHTLGLTVVAEGVEAEHQLQYLKDCNCDYIQGYLYSKPLENEALHQLLTADSSTQAPDQDKE